jgi:predicted acylesterase/phospholipase RssA
VSDAFVLAGAGAKGAFTAGALSVLSEPVSKERLGLDITRIVGASSGALNGVYYAAAIRAGDEAFAGERLAELWLEDASLGGAFDVSLRDIAAGLGVSSQDKILALLRSQIRPSTGREPIELRLVITNASGETVTIDGGPATTFEHVVDVGATDFDSPEGLERAFTAAVASAAIPGVFAPVSMSLGGRTVQAMDGGIVDDAPLGRALERAPDIARLFVCAPYPRVRAEPPDLHGLALAWHVFDLLVQERLIRDLQRVENTNRVLGDLASLVPDPDKRADLLHRLGWTGRRPVQIVEIRPDEELPGNAFSGFTSAELRQRYVSAGVDAARRVVGSLTAPAES